MTHACRKHRLDLEGHHLPGGLSPNGMVTSQQVRQHKHWNSVMQASSRFPGLLSWVVTSSLKALVEAVPRT